MKLLLSLLSILTLGSATIVAQSSAGVDVLNFAPNPEALSISEATTAVPQGASSIFVNPALLSLMPSSTLNLGYSRMVGDANNIFGGVNFKQGNRAIAISVYRSGDDGFEQRNSPGSSNGNFSVDYLSVGSALSYNFKHFAIGASAHYIYQEIYLDKATGYSFNAGIARELLDTKLTIGASVVNIGKMNKLVTVEPKLPAAFRLGLSFDLLEFTPPKNANLPILLSISSDFVHPLTDTPKNTEVGYFNDKDYFNFGFILNVAEVVELNGGYKTGDTARPISFGAGFITDLITFNYAIIPFNTGFGTVHSIGIQYKF